MQITGDGLGFIATLFFAGLGFVVWLVRLEGKVVDKNKGNTNNRESIKVLYGKIDTTNGELVDLKNDIVAIIGDVKVTDEKFNSIHKDLSQINKKLDKLLE